MSGDPEYISLAQLGRLAAEDPRDPTSLTACLARGRVIARRLEIVGMAGLIGRPVTELRIVGGAPRTREEAAELLRALEAAERMRENEEWPRAYGHQLDYLATDRGFQRHHGETDAELRARILAGLRP